VIHPNIRNQWLFLLSESVFHPFFDGLPSREKNLFIKKKISFVG